MMDAAHELFYSRPAGDWNEALPLGNGRIGAMVFGGTDKETLCLNEDTLWSGYPSFYERPDAPAAFREAGELTKRGAYKEAEILLERDMTAGSSQMYLPLGDLELIFPKTGEVEGYRRSLDLRRAVHVVEYEADGAAYRRETIVSAPAQVMAMHLTVSAAGRLSFQICLHSQLRTNVRAKGKGILMEGLCPSAEQKHGSGESAVLAYDENHPGIRFAAWIRAETDGEVRAEGESLFVQGASRATLYFAARTSFNGWDRDSETEGRPYLQPCEADIREAAELGYERIRAAHEADYGSLYGRTKLCLPESETSALPTDQRLAAHERGARDDALYALLFHYGRYLAIAGSRAGTQPANLQGIWNHQLYAPWRSNYTMNINTEMNYWPMLMTNLEECCQPLLQMIEELRESGRRTAKAYYGARGFCSHHNSDLWRLSTPVGNGCSGSAPWALWPMSSGWLMRHLYEYWEYTQEDGFLTERLLPALEECALFYLDLLEEDGQGLLVFRPATSPENVFWLPDGTRAALADWTAMSQAIVRDVFRMALDAGEKAGREDAVLEEIRRALPRVHGYEVSATGSLMEFNEDFRQNDPYHRHLSHLYGLHPGRELSAGTPLGEAARQSLNERGDGGTGWSLAWKVNFWARLGDGDRAGRLLDMQLRPCTAGGVDYGMRGGTYPNMLCAHPPFQIDGNFGVCAGIGEMLLQGDAKNPQFLPALPSSWKEGSVRGLRLRGGKTADIVWKDGRLLRYELRD